MSQRLECAMLLRDVCIFVRVRECAVRIDIMDAGERERVVGGE